MGEEKQAGLWGTDLERMRKIRLWLGPRTGEISGSTLTLELVSFSGQGPPTPAREFTRYDRQTAPPAGGAAGLEVSVFCQKWDRAQTELPKCRALEASLCPPMVPNVLGTPGEGGLLMGEMGRQSEWSCNCDW